MKPMTRPRRSLGPSSSARQVLPSPQQSRLVGHLGQWGINPLGVLESGARAAEVAAVGSGEPATSAVGPGQGKAFELRLWRRAIVGYSTQWNRGVLGDLDTFRSRGGLSALSPYLNAGIVQTDAPEHRPQRTDLNLGFTKGALNDLSTSMRTTIERHVPTGDFDAVTWASTVVRAVLSATFLGTETTDPVLNRWLGPMEQPLPSPFLPRPVRFRAMNARLTQALADPPSGTLAQTFAVHGGLPEMRVALAAGYDTTAHTLAWLLAHVAQDPGLLDPARRDAAIKETLRLYPAGWTGSRQASRDVTVDGVHVPKGTLVLYSPYLTHRDAALWDRPKVFDAERFATGSAPAWGYIPFAAGERTCLGRHYAHLLMRTALESIQDRNLRFVEGELSPRAGVTLRPAGPLHLHLSTPSHQHHVGRNRPNGTPEGTL
ncbi:MAG: cytochrome P450 [Ornithinimicrobium sp.]